MRWAPVRPVTDCHSIDEPVVYVRPGDGDQYRSDHRGAVVEAEAMAADLVLKHWASNTED